MHTTGTAKLLLGSDEEAVTWLRRAIDTNRNHPMAHLSLAAALAHPGRLDEARVAAQAGLALNPAFRIARTYANPASDNPTFLAHAQGRGARVKSFGRAQASRDLSSAGCPLRPVLRFQSPLARF